ncbi:MAG: hypothetical protein EBZ11_01565 [Alphaproteobacteria bacterium]|nr:hypothetical protein [Alphaproteobacteria bacterium]
METPKQNSLAGICFSLSAGFLWAIVPLYIKYIDADDPYEIIAHRSLWSAVLLFMICWVVGQLGDIWRLIRVRRNLFNFFVTTCLLSLNWGFYVYAVQSEQVVAAALGYFVYPLFPVLDAGQRASAVFWRWGCECCAGIAGWRDYSVAASAVFKGQSGA